MWIGIDVAKAELVVALRPTVKRWTEPNDEQGYRPWSRPYRVRRRSSSSSR
jgi:hypothetical protein